MKHLFTSLLFISVLLLSSFKQQNTIDEVIGALRSANPAR
jgi:hypothetical protein